MRKYTNTQSAFTIVELAVTITIIAILVTLAIVGWNGWQTRSATTVLHSDLRSAAAQLESDRQWSKTGYVSSADNLPKSDGTTYAYTSDSKTYCLAATSHREGVPSFHMTNDSNEIHEGECPDTGAVAIDPIPDPTPTPEPLVCPAGFIVVPGSSHYGTSDFCVMKYEAKNVGGVATSQAGSAPWGNISQDNARTIAQGACTGCHLITEPEWMTIAMNVISVPSNWVSGTVGSGTMYRGYSDGSVFGGLAASSSDSNGYYLTGSSNPSVQRRTFMLSNGEVIWDIAGNIWEWTDATITGAQPGLPGEVTGSWKEYNNPNLQWNNLPVTSRPTGTLYSSSQGVGSLYSSPSSLPTHTRAFIRGGKWNEGSKAGVLALALYPQSFVSGADMGFRVAK